MSTMARRVTNERPGTRRSGILRRPRIEWMGGLGDLERLGRARPVCYHTPPLVPFGAVVPAGRSSPGVPHHVESEGPFMARACAVCGKVSMGGFNPQSSGMNRVRAHRRMQPNLQPLVIATNGNPTRA